MLTCDLTARRNGFRLEVALDVDLDELVAIVGPNGAGKTTLLRALAGLDPISGGSVRVGGLLWEDVQLGIRLPPEKRGVGYVPQAGLLFPHLSVLDNVSFGLEAPSRSMATEWLARLGLEDLAHAMPDQLSGGQMQLVSFARAQARQPTLFLLDEPLASVDAANRAAVRRILRRELSASPAYRILVTHDPLEAAAFADRIVVLEAGRIIQTGSIDDLRSHPRSNYVAELVGVNFFSGEADSGVITVDSGATLISASAPDGPVLATVHPRAVSLYTAQPSGSPRNVWFGTIAAIEPSLDQVRIHVTGPIDLVAEVTHAGGQAFSEGDAVWSAVKATEVIGYPR